jgi:acyl dehydratase
VGLARNRKNCRTGALQSDSSSNCKVDPLKSTPRSTLRSFATAIGRLTMALNYDVLRSRPAAKASQRYSRKDTILYALGVGSGQSAGSDSRELKFVYERDLAVLPTMAAVLAAPRFWASDPEASIDTKDVMHSAQTLVVHKPLAPEGTVTADTVISNIFDKGAGKSAVVQLTRKLWDGRGDLMAVVGTTMFIRGAGGFGGERGPPRDHDTAPDDRSADATFDLPIRPEQGLVYRLSGDDNPLHVDPIAAKAAGFDRPILHGLCTYGFAGRAILHLFCGCEPRRLRRFDARFTSPVYPGDTLRIEAWRRGPGEAVFRCLVPVRNVIAIDNGYVEFTD